METRKVEVINPYNHEHIEMLNDFCLRNDIDNLGKKLYQMKQQQDEMTYLKNKTTNPMIDEYIAMFEQDKIIDYCALHGEKDIRHCFLSFPKILEKRNTKDRKMVKLAVDYAFTLGMEEVFISPDNQDIFLQENLKQLGFVSLGQNEDKTPYVLAKEEVVKEKVAV